VQRPERRRRSGEGFAVSLRAEALRLKHQPNGRFGADGEGGATPGSFGEGGGLRRFGVIGHRSEGLASCYGQVLVPGFYFVIDKRGRGCYF